MNKELEDLKQQFILDVEVPEEYHTVMDYIKENTDPKEKGIRNKMAIWFLNTLGKSNHEMAQILKLKHSTIVAYRYELIRRQLITEDGKSIVDMEHPEVDICLKILTLKGMVVVVDEG